MKFIALLFISLLMFPSCSRSDDQKEVLAAIARSDNAYLNADAEDYYSRQDTSCKHLNDIMLLHETTGVLEDFQVGWYSRFSDDGAYERNRVKWMLYCE
jgi:hypothetical protein